MIKIIIIVAHVELVQNIILISTGLRNIMPICSLQSPHHVAQYHHHYLRKSDSPKAFTSRCILLASHEWNAFGESIFTWYSTSCSNYMTWYLVAGQSIQGISSWKHSLGENINLNTNRLIRYLNKVFPNLRWWYFDMSM